jgi:FkbM family methyltransferase
MTNHLIIDQDFKTQFRTAARANGKLYENTITAFYTELGADWPTGTIVIDGGAHAGMHSLPLAALPSVERVIAVEASPATFAAFQSKLRGAKNGAKVDLHQVAIQADPSVETVEFVHSQTHPGRSGINPLTRGKDGVEFEPPTVVPATTIDKLSASVESRVRFIKLDLEGGEFAALQGGKETLRAGRASCVFETGKHAPAMNGYAPDDVLLFMESVQFRLANFFGEPITPETLASARYGWAFPIEEFDEQCDRLRRLVVAALQSQPRSEAACTAA